MKLIYGITNNIINQTYTTLTLYERTVSKSKHNIQESMELKHMYYLKLSLDNLKSMCVIIYLLNENIQ